MSNGDEKSTELVAEESTTAVNPFENDEANISTRHLYGEIVWLKVFDFPYWPAVILHPSWVSPVLSVKLKLNRKKIQNRLIVQFFDEVNSSQVVGIKNISYPFDAFYEEYTNNNSIDPSFIERAKEMNELTQIERCRLYNPTMDESNLLDQRKCIVCNCDIDDIDPVDLIITRGNHAQPPTESHFSSKSYYRCIRSSCLSLYHKKCVSSSSFTGICGICQVTKDGLSLLESHSFVEKKRPMHGEEDRKRPSKPVQLSDDEIPNRRRQRRGDSDDENKLSSRRHPTRSTRSPTYCEDEQAMEKATRKREGGGKGGGKGKREKSELLQSEKIFVKLTEKESFDLINEVMDLVFSLKETIKDSVHYVKTVKEKVRPLVAVGDG